MHHANEQTHIKSQATKGIYEIEFFNYTTGLIEHIPWAKGLSRTASLTPKVGVRSAYPLPSPDPTVTLGIVCLIEHIKLNFLKNWRYRQVKCSEVLYSPCLKFPFATLLIMTAFESSKTHLAIRHSNTYKREPGAYTEY